MIKQGAVFEMSCVGNRFGYGQIIRAGIVFYASILRPLYDCRPSLDQLDVSDTLAFARTTDGCFYRNEWVMIGSLPLPTEIPYPNAKVNIEGKLYVTDFGGRRVREASIADDARYDFERSVSSPLLQDAFMAHHGLIEENDFHRRLGVAYLRARCD